MSTERVQLFLFRQTGNGYMPLYGGVEIQAGKVTSCQIPEAHRALWREVSEALRIELALRALHDACPTIASVIDPRPVKAEASEGGAEAA